MKYSITLKEREKYQIDDFLDTLIEEKPEFHTVIMNIDFTNNSAIIYSDGELKDFILTTFNSKIQSGLFLFEYSKMHNPFHHTFLLNGYMLCGCGWKESEQEKIAREITIAYNPESNKLGLVVVKK